MPATSVEEAGRQASSFFSRRLIPLSAVSFGVSAFAGRALQDKQPRFVLGGGLLLIGAGGIRRVGLGERGRMAVAAAIAIVAAIATHVGTSPR